MDDRYKRTFYTSRDVLAIIQLILHTQPLKRNDISIEISKLFTVRKKYDALYVAALEKAGSHPRRHRRQQLKLYCAI
jgi:hypothetical protein